MGLSDVRISRIDKQLSIPDPQKRAPRGFNGLPRAGRELLEDGTVLLYHRAKREKFTPVFWTVTMPSRFEDGSEFTEHDYQRLLVGSSALTHRIFDELTRLCQRRGLPNVYMYVIEPQEQRWRRDGVLALHIHAVIPNRWDPSKPAPSDRGFRRTGNWAITTDDTDTIVQRCISNLLGKSVNARSACNLQGISGLNKLFFYLTKLNKIGKYMSKGSRLVGELQDSSWSSYLPANWYGSDKVTRQQIRTSVQYFDIGEGTAGEVVQELQRLSAEFERYQGRPLLTEPHITSIERDQGLLPVAISCRVRWLTDIPAALEAISQLDLFTVKRNEFVLDQVRCA